MKSTLKYSVCSILPILILTSLVSGIGELSFSNRATAETVAPPTSASEITLPEAIKMVRGHASKNYGVSRKRWRCRDFYYDRRDPTRPRRRPRRIQQDCRATVEVTPKAFGWVMVVSGIRREPTYDRGYSHMKITYHVTKSGRLTVVDP